ncbi:MAG: recombinase family protein, partial [Actinobacteria bacterium]|nr:recombinase family protein [Actinomycetota bacterium]
RICSQKARATAAGAWTGGGRPFGFTPGGTVLEPIEADVIRDGVRRVLARESLYSITRSWQANVPTVKGGRWQAQSVARVLTRPRNAGLAAHRGEIVGRGSWPAIITEDEHRAVVAVLKDPERSTYAGVRTLRWVGSGLYLCGRCGSDLASGSAHRGGVGTRVYRCRASRHLTIYAERLDEFVTETVCGVRGAGCGVLARDGAGLLPVVDREAVADLHAAANTLRGRLKELGDMLGDGELTRAQYARQRERVETKIDAVTTQLAAQQTGTVLDGVANAEDPAAAFLAVPVARRRAIIDCLASVTISPARPGRLPTRVKCDYARVRIEPK